MKRLDQELLDSLAAAAAASPRRRANHNLHPQLADPVQRFLNALQPDTYVRPHRHATPPRWELFLVVRGRVALLVFDAEARVVAREELAAGGSVFGVELAPDTWHALVALEPSVMFEVKAGPYDRLSDKDFAPWAPSEGAPETAAWVEWYRTACSGDCAPP